MFNILTFDLKIQRGHDLLVFNYHSTKQCPLTHRVDYKPGFHEDQPPAAGVAANLNRAPGSTISYEIIGMPPDATVVPRVCGIHKVPLSVALSPNQQTVTMLLPSTFPSLGALLWDWRQSLGYVVLRLI